MLLLHTIWSSCPHWPTGEVELASVNPKKRNVRCQVSSVAVFLINSQVACFVPWHLAIFENPSPDLRVGSQSYPRALASRPVRWAYHLSFPRNLS